MKTRPHLYIEWTIFHRSQHFRYIKIKYEPRKIQIEEQKNQDATKTNIKMEQTLGEKKENNCDNEGKKPNI